MNANHQTNFKKRWTATVVYKVEVGLMSAEYYIEELDELKEIIENGPSFETIEKIEIVYNCVYSKTVEQTIREQLP